MPDRALNALAPDEAAALAHAITSAFTRGALDLSRRPGAPIPGWGSMPEFRAAARLRERGIADPDLRVFLTLIAAVDRARDADRLWNDAAVLYEQAPWVFSVAALVRSEEELAGTLKAGRVTQRHGPDSDAWRTVLASLHDEAVPLSVRTAVFDGLGETTQLLKDVRTADRLGRPRFPLLRGPKISVMWVRMLAAPGNARIRGLMALPVAVDTQVRKVSEYLGVAPTQGLSDSQARSKVQSAWQAGVHGAVGPDALCGTAAALDPALWFFAKWGCTFCERAGRRLPIHDACRECSLGGSP